MRKLLTALLVLVTLSVSSQTNCPCQTYLPSDTLTVPAEKAMHFDGYNDRQVQFGDVTCFDAGPHTVRTVIRFLTTTSTVGRPIWSKWANTGNQRSVELLISGTNKLVLRISTNGTTVVTATGSTTLSNLSDFQDIVYEYNPSGSTNDDKIKIWLNKVQETLTFNGTVPSSIYNSTSPLRWGLEGAGTTYDQLNAYINQFTITTDLLTQAEIDSIYNNGKGLITNLICDNVFLQPLIDSATFNSTTNVWTIPNGAGMSWDGTSTNMYLKERVPKNPYWDKRYLVIWHWGQSNSGTYVNNSNLHPVFRESRADVTTWQGQDLKILTTSTSTFPTINGGTHGDQFAMGWDLSDKLPHDIIFINYSAGGTSMYDYWKYGASLYTDMIKTIDSVHCYLQSHGIKYDFWGNGNQGEHDSQTALKSGAYENLFTQFMDSVMVHYPCMKGYVSTLTRDNLGTGFTYSPTVQAAQDSVITRINIPTYMKANVDGYSPGILHINATDQQNQGRFISPMILSHY